jgi:histidine ammonia-lyase
MSPLVLTGAGVGIGDVVIAARNACKVEVVPAVL